MESNGEALGKGQTVPSMARTETGHMVGTNTSVPPREKVSTPASLRETSTSISQRHRTEFFKDYPHQFIDFDNDAGKARLNVHRVYDELSQLASPEAAKSVIAWVQRFSNNVQNARAEGMHLGSSNLQFAIGASFYERPGQPIDPKRFNLETETEMKLVARLLEQMVELVP